MILEFGPVSEVDRVIFALPIQELAMHKTVFEVEMIKGIDLLVNVLISVFVGIVSLGAKATQNNKELSIALNAEFETLNPVVNSMMASIYILDATLRPLVALTPKGIPQAILIKEIPSLKNKKASLIRNGKAVGLKAQIEILPKAQWGDGTPLTCYDVRATWEIGKDPYVSAPAHDEFLNIEDIQIDKKDPKKCVVIFKEAKWNFYLNFPRPMPAHHELKIFNEYKNKTQGYERNSLYVKDITNPGIYNGPYYVSELKVGSHLVLTANPHFFGRAPYFKRIIFKFILNSSTMLSNLLTKNVMMTSTSGLGFEQALAFAKKTQSEDLPYNVIFVPSVIYAHMDFYLEHPFLSDVRVRKALAFSLNRESMVTAFFEGKQKAAYHFSTEGDSWYTDKPNEIVIYEYSKAKANQLLEDAGWKLEKDGYRYKNGKKLTLTISGVADNKLNEMVEVFMQGAWKQVGVDLHLKNYPARVFFAEIVRKRNYDLAFYSWVSNPDGNQKAMLHSQMIPSKENSWSGSNRPGWRNKKVDKWLEQVEQEFDSKKRISIMKKVLKVYTEELPALPLYYRTNNAVIPKDLKNFRPSGSSYTEFLEVENWSY